MVIIAIMIRRNDTYTDRDSIIGIAQLLSKEKKTKTALRSLTQPRSRYGHYECTQVHSTLYRPYVAGRRGWERDRSRTSAQKEGSWGSEEGSWGSNTARVTTFTSYTFL